LPCDEEIGALTRLIRPIAAVARVAIAANDPDLGGRPRALIESIPQEGEADASHWAEDERGKTAAAGAKTSGTMSIHLRRLRTPR
jgi:hypothetical protein